MTSPDVQISDPVDVVFRDPVLVTDAEIAENLHKAQQTYWNSVDKNLERNEHAFGDLYGLPATESPAPEAIPNTPLSTRLAIGACRLLIRAKKVKLREL